MKVRDSAAWKGDLLIVNGKRHGRITGYEAATGMITFKRFSLWRRVWYWFCDTIRKGKK